LIIDGTNGLTFNNATTQASAGQVLQVVQGTTTTQVTIASGTVSTGLTASITPKFSTSKILVFISSQFYIGNSTAANVYGFFTLKRGSTSIYAGATAEIQTQNSIALAGRYALNWLDSPATTSSTSYTLFYSPMSGDAHIMNNNSQTGVITLMEIAQ
jgi:hypothetical protein